MAGKDIFNDKDTMDINELASLNDDISPELIEQLQQKLAQEALNLSGGASAEFNQNDDSTLFEEPTLAEPPAEPEPKPAPVEFEDTFAKKYQAKLNNMAVETPAEETVEENTISSAAFMETEVAPPPPENIEQVSNNITERSITPEQKTYNDSLNFLDGNVKYSKYVIYIDPQNVEFIDGLTVKERKNLINKILREQDDIAITKQRFRVIQTVIKHAIVAILTIAISIPVIYFTINSSLEATINNYRRSQSVFQTLYKEKGKIQSLK